LEFVRFLNSAAITREIASFLATFVVIVNFFATVVFRTKTLLTGLLLLLLLLLAWFPLLLLVFVIFCLRASAAVATFFADLVLSAVLGLILSLKMGEEQLWIGRNGLLAISFSFFFR